MLLGPIMLLLVVPPLKVVFLGREKHLPTTELE